MLISYSVSNFCSFDDPVEISFEKTGGRQHPQQIIDGRYLVGGVIYGANASGKSNFLNSLWFLKKALKTEDISKLSLGIRQFKYSDNDVTTFKVDFVVEDDHYLYSAKIKPTGFVFESLVLLDGTAQGQLIFSRNQTTVKNEYLLKNEWFVGKNSVTEKMSYIKLLDSLGVESVEGEAVKHIKNLQRFFKGVILYSDKMSVSWPALYRGIRELGDFTNFLNKLLHRADTGIDEICFEEMSAGETKEFLRDAPSLPEKDGEVVLVASKHPYNQDYYAFSRCDGEIVGQKLKITSDGKSFELGQQSVGTIKIIKLALLLYSFLNLSSDMFIMIDELDSSLHPFLVKEMLMKLLDAQKESKSQLLVTLHDTFLMDIQDIWRADEIWFMKKDYDHSSKLYSLADFEPRIDKKISNDYLAGKYGAIPFLGSDLFVGSLEKMDADDAT